MRVVNRNRRPIAYAFYEGTTELTDENGNFTGEFQVNYSDPVRALMNVSGGRGQANVRLLGIGSEFDRTIVTDDLETPFSTDTVFWIETDPDNDPFDYRVVRVARTINQVVLGLTEVDTKDSNGD